MRLLLLATVLLAAAVPVRAAEPEVVGGGWLVVKSVDERARVPFNPDALMRRYLLERDAPPPVEGESVRGTREEAQAWTTLAADEKGTVAGDFSMAYRAVISEGARIVLADLSRGSTLYVNGTPYAGDIYGSGTGPVPVALRDGRNDVYVRGVRGGFRLTFADPEGDVVLTGKDTTAPDYVVGDGFQGNEAAVVVANCTPRWATLVASGREDSDRMLRLDLRIPPLGVLKVPVGVHHDVVPEEGAEALEIGVVIDVLPDGADAVVRARGTVSIKVRTPDQAYVRTFRSAIDGSVQEYAVRDSADGDRSQLVLSVHGAGVRCRGQANAYSARPGVVVVAATNRRRFGFDWQDWGRADAYEVLDEALAWSQADWARVCLTGHSMGGHGTWHIAANDPDGFAAIAPSAGWSQFDHYGRGDRSQAHREPWYGADAASDTLSLINNLKQLPTYVLHGTDDDNVPLSEAQRMIEALRAAGAAPQAHFQEGAGHWWNGDTAEGADCVDWPAIFELFAASRIPDDPLHIEWTTVDPAVDSRHHWVTVQQPIEYGKRCRVEGRWNPGSGEAGLTTENVRLLQVRWPDGEGQLRAVTLDGRRVPVPGAPAAQWFENGEDGWQLSDGPVAGEKSPTCSGPFKRAFGNEFVLVLGTQGSDEENRELLDRARYDSEVWRYRGNGLAEVVEDVDFAASGGAAFAGRNVILYGNADTNAAWDLVFDEHCPIRAHRGALTVGRQTWERPDAAAIFVHRRRGETRALAAAFTDTGPAGTRLQATLLTFVSGVGYPDYTAFVPDVLERGDAGVLSAGWFDRRWRIE